MYEEKRRYYRERGIERRERQEERRSIRSNLMKEKEIGFVVNVRI